MACLNGSVLVARLLLDHGADANYEAELLVRWHWDGLTPIHFASVQGDLAIARLLMAHGADIGMQDSLGETALGKASRFGQVAMV